MFSWFLRKKEVEQIKHDAKRGFDDVKKDMDSISAWIKHLDSEKNVQQEDIREIKEVLSSIQEELEGVKNVVSVMGELHPRGKTQQLSKQQTAVYAVQTGVQTGVQTPKLDQFSVTERAIIWILLNTDMKLSYDDVAAILGKERSTIRGQLNAIKQKNEGLLNEVIEKNGKKRVFISEEIKEILLKKAKVRINKAKKPVKKSKNTKNRVKNTA